MKVYHLVAQRPESYSAEFVPELLASADETTMEENPQYFQGEINKVLQWMLDGDFTHYGVVVTEVPDEAIRTALDWVVV